MGLTSALNTSLNGLTLNEPHQLDLGAGHLHQIVDARPVDGQDPGNFTTFLHRLGRLCKVKDRQRARDRSSGGA